MAHTSRKKSRSRSGHSVSPDSLPTNSKPSASASQAMGNTSQLSFPAVSSGNNAASASSENGVSNALGNSFPLKARSISASGRCGVPLQHAVSHTPSFPSMRTIASASKGRMPPSARTKKATVPEGACRTGKTAWRSPGMRIRLYTSVPCSIPCCYLLDAAASFPP